MTHLALVVISGSLYVSASWSAQQPAPPIVLPIRTFLEMAEKQTAGCL